MAERRTTDPTTTASELVFARVGDFKISFGESPRSDHARSRLYFVDCASRTLHWLDDAEPPLHTFQMPSLPTGIALTTGDDLVVCLGDGLHIVDADAGTTGFLVPYPEGRHGRANDANADPAGVGAPEHRFQL